jgi:hypothetical protein
MRQLVFPKKGLSRVAAERFHFVATIGLLEQDLQPEESTRADTIDRFLAKHAILTSLSPLCWRWQIASPGFRPGRRP